MATAHSTSALPDVRADFPVLEREWNGHRVTYIDSAATSQKPRAVLEAMDRFLNESNASVHRGVYDLGREATELFEGARERIATFVGGKAETTVFTHNATEAINLVAYAWARDNLGPGDEILITRMEHHSNVVPWQLVCQDTGAKLRYLEVGDDGQLSLDELDSVLAEGRMISGVEDEMSTWAELPHKFEAGTSAIAEAIGLGAAIDYLGALGMESVRAHERELTAYALERLPEVPGLTLYGPPDAERRGGGVSF